MTRFLSEALNAREPYFGHGLRHLESANGNPSTDIRFTSEVINQTRLKLAELGLDPRDTTPEELFHALIERIKMDDKVLTRSLRTIAANKVSAEADPVAGMVEAVNQLADSKRCFALKTSRMKLIIKANPPKKAMKQLGYRSLDSMLKTEPVALIITAAWLIESHAWQRRLLDQYKKFKASDFEERNIVLLHPSSTKWQKLATKIVEQNKHNILSVKELGAIILLPLPIEIPTGVLTASLALTLHELNEIRASSSFLKLNQVRPDFGEILAKLVSREPELKSQLLDQPVPWNLIQRYYARMTDHFKEGVFEPYLRLEDMVWHPIEQSLEQIEPKLRFWKGSSHLGVVHNAKAVSLNILDAALNSCNTRNFDNRINSYFEHSLWQELLLRYLKHDPVEQTVLTELQPQFAFEPVVA
jgi:hypothetical protein